MWYDLHPTAYAVGLRYSAANSDKSAVRRLSEGRPWSPGEAEHFRLQARRLRAMALLCENSSATRAGDVDFRGLSDPTTSKEDVERIVAKTEAEFGAPAKEQN